MTRPVIPSIESLADELTDKAVGPVFGIPGGGPSLELLDALERRGVAYVRTHFEGCAALMAGTMGRLSGEPGMCLSIKGPGLANMVSGLAASALEGFPLLAVCEAFPRDTDWTVRHKGMDHPGLTSAVSKGCFGIAGKRVVENAVALAKAEVPGPVVLNLNDEQAPPPPVTPETSVLGPVIKQIEMAKRPVVIVGSLAARSVWASRLESLAVPVFVTAAAKGALDEGLRYSAGVFTGVGLEHTPEAKIVPQSDLVIGLGLRAGEVLATKPFECPAVNVDTIGSDQGFEFLASAQCQILDSVFDALDAFDWGSDLVADVVTSLDNRLRSSGFLPAHALAAIQRRFSGQVRGVFDTGNFCTIAEHIWRPAHPNHCLMSGKGRYMGTALPMAIAAAEYDPSVPTVAVLGDGGIGMFLAEARLAVERTLPLLIVLMSDGGFGSVRGRALKDGLTQAPLIINDPSWLIVLEGMGIPGVAVNKEEDLSTALEAWVPVSGPSYVEISFDPDAYQEMIIGIR